MPRLIKSAIVVDHHRTFEATTINNEDTHMALSKPSVIATEGQTIDGRQITKEQIQQMAASYDPNVYTAVAKLEHLLSLSPESVFSAYGKVISLGTQEASIFGERKLQLTAIVEASDSLVAMQKDGKKAFASIEIEPNFIRKGIAYLSGLAFTDSPASLGTESLKFSAGKQQIYSFNEEVEVVFEATIQQDKPGDGLFSKVKSLLSGKDKKDEAKFTDIGLAVEAIATSQKELLEKFSDHEPLRAEITALTKKVTESEAAFNALSATVEKLSELPNGAGKRPSATGASGHAETDC